MKGNEHADMLAKKGASLPQPETPVTYEAAQQIIKSNFREEWMNEWARGKTGRAIYKYMNKPNNKDNINGLHRGEQTDIFRLRRYDVQLNMYVNRINPQHSPACELCKAP